MRCNGPGDDVIDIGEIARDVAVIEDFDRFACKDSTGEQIGRHVGPAPRSIDGKEPKSRHREAMEVAIAFCNHLAAGLGRGIKRYRMIYPILGAGGLCCVGAVDRGGRCVDDSPQMVHPTRRLQHHEGSHHIRVHIGVGILQRMSHSGLCCEMDDAVQIPVPLPQCEDTVSISDVELVKGEAGMAAKLRKARLLETHVIIIVKIIDANDLFAAYQ